MKFNKSDLATQICILINCVIAAYDSYGTQQSPIVLLLITILLFK
jgi:hypothetical protein